MLQFKNVARVWAMKYSTDAFSSADSEVYVLTSSPSCSGLAFNNHFITLFMRLSHLYAVCCQEILSTPYGRWGPGEIGNFGLFLLDTCMRRSRSIVSNKSGSQHLVNIRQRWNYIHQKPEAADCYLKNSVFICSGIHANWRSISVTLIMKIWGWFSEYSNIIFWYNDRLFYIANGINNSIFDHGLQIGREADKLDV